MTHASASPSSPRPSSSTAGTAGGARRRHAPTGALSERTASLLEQRGLDIELCSRLGIETASAPGGGDDWIAIPFVQGGRTVGHKYRRVVKVAGEANFSADQGSRFSWWNHDVLTDPTLPDQLIITEGEFDALVALQCGFGRVVSVPGGAPSQATADGSGYGYVADTLPLLTEVREIILAVDSDEPGVALMNDLAKRLGRGRCRYVTYPPGCKDLGETLLLHGQAGVVRCLAEAHWVAIPGLYTLAELPPIADPVPHVTGIHGLGDHFRIRLGDLSVLTGLPGSGKSTLVNDLACRMAEKYGWHVCFASPEQNPQIDHRRALRTWVNHKPEHSQSQAELDGADQFINRNFSFVVGLDDEEFDLEWTLDKLASAIIRFDAKLCIIDPWNEMDHAKPKDQTTTEYVGWAIRQLKKFARKWQVHMLVVAHPAKIQAKDGVVPRPTPYDIADSAHWWNKPDACLVLHPEKDKDGGKFTGLHVLKSRYHDKIGKPGSARLVFITSTARFEAAS